MFKDYVVVITGAASGIGFETARQFVENGALVIGADFNEKTLSVAAQGLGDRFTPKRCDVTSEAQVSSLSVFVEERFGKLDVLVNNAGRGRSGISLEKMTEDDFYFHYDVLVKGPMLMVKHFTRLLRKSSNPSIVNIGSGAVVKEHPNNALYGTAKAALDKFTRHLVRDLPGIRSNTILPGLTDTPIYTSAMGIPREAVDQLFEKMKSRVPCGRIGWPDDIANCILFLSSDKASYINGACILIDGGYTIYGPDWGV